MLVELTFLDLSVPPVDPDEAAARKLEQFDQALARLEISDTELPHTRACLRKRIRSQRDTRTGLSLALLNVLCLLIAVVGMLMLGSGATNNRGFEVEGLDDVLQWLGGAVGIVAAVTLPWLPLVCLTLFVPNTRVGYRLFSESLTADTTSLILLCSVVVDPELAVDARNKKFCQLDRAHCKFEQGLLRAHYTVATMTAGSPRRTAAQEHAAKVAALVRVDFIRLDTEPDKALRDLATKYSIIGEQYARGLVGELLPTDALRDVQTLSTNRSTVRDSLHVMLIGVSALVGGIAFHTVGIALSFPDLFMPWAAALGAFFGAIAVSSWRRVVGLIGHLPML